MDARCATSRDQGDGPLFDGLAVGRVDYSNSTGSGSTQARISVGSNARSWAAEVQTATASAGSPFRQQDGRILRVSADQTVNLLAGGWASVSWS